MCMDVEKFNYRNQFAKVISSGPKPKVYETGGIHCHQCGTKQEVVIENWVKEHCPPTDLLPLDSLHWQATFNGWAIAPMQVYTGNQLLEWNLALCPDCVDKWLSHISDTIQPLNELLK